MDLVTREEQCGPGTDIQVHSTVGFRNWEGKSVTRQENKHIKDYVTQMCKYLRERVLSIFFVSTGRHNTLSEFFPACITEGKLMVPLIFSILSQTILRWTSLFLIRVTGLLPGYLKLLYSLVPFEMHHVLIEQLTVQLYGPGFKSRSISHTDYSL